MNSATTHHSQAGTKRHKLLERTTFKPTVQTFKLNCNANPESTTNSTHVQLVVNTFPLTSTEGESPHLLTKKRSIYSKGGVVRGEVIIFKPEVWSTFNHYVSFTATRWSREFYCSRRDILRVNSHTSTQCNAI